MPYCFESDSADGAWRQAANTLLGSANRQLQDSRCGKTRELLHVNFHISNPRERWVLSRQPGINPAFAIAEVFWILAGRNDSQFINYWNPELPKFAGQDEKYHGAYGYRLRRQFGFDQLERASAALDKNPDSRQIVLEIWDARSDFPAVDGSPVSEDIPCNVCSMLKVRDGRLDWMQIMRSNDLFLGTPHNFVQFTMLQEIIAGWLGLDIGGYGHFSDSLHAYEAYGDQVDKYSIAQIVPTATNPDRLGLPKAESDIMLRKVMGILEAFTSTDLSVTKFRDHCTLDDLPEAYRNLIFIVAADAARRRMAADGARRKDWNAIMDRAAASCTNPVLRLAWDGWRQRRIRD